jgi:dTMP kinase
MLLYMASRAQLVEERIRPALARGELVLADRFVSSTLAYQGAGGGLPREDIEAVARAACQEVRPDLVVIFDADEATASKRVSAEPDRIESRDEAYRARVRRGYLAQAHRDPERCVVIDAAPPANDVQRAMLATIRERLT